MHNFRFNNLKFKHSIDDITIDLYSSRNFTNIEDIIRKCNLMVNLSKFTSNKKLLSGGYNKVCCQTLFLSKKSYHVDGPNLDLRPKSQRDFGPKRPIQLICK